MAIHILSFLDLRYCIAVHYTFFSQYDPEGFGEIPWPDLVEALAQPEFQQRVGAGKREVLLDKARTATTPAITFQDFVNVVSTFKV